ncbi:hypothetical protein GCM10008938_32640 [Deinococcus roseus]|uniref:Uncharacterized protein n=2 Tax=Deinococcus roseus TaxID=392414 RepID=A0ABQ2D2V7_9DEIO|nr:hypothetical protein GCM10008938_32640 [Deinococcus roseus]
MIYAVFIGVLELQRLAEREFQKTGSFSADAVEFQTQATQERKHLMDRIAQRIQRPLSIDETAQLEEIGDRLGAAWHGYLYVWQTTEQLIKPLRENPETLKSAEPDTISDWRVYIDEPGAHKDLLFLVEHHKRELYAAILQMETTKPLPKAKSKSSGKVYRSWKHLHVMVQKAHLFDRLLGENASKPELENLLRELDKLQDPQLSTVVAMRKAMVLLEMEHPQQALDILEQHPNSPLYPGLKGQALVKLGRLHEAKDWLGL